MKPGQYAHTFEKDITKHVRMDYLLYLPPEYSKSKKKWPLILFLHGAGERGSDLNRVKVHGPPKLVAKEKKDFTIYPEAKHDSWTVTYNNPELYEWFLKHKRSKKK